MSKKKKKKKHIIQPVAKGPQSKQYVKKRGKKFKLKFGLSDEALVSLGYQYTFDLFHKILFVASICLLMLPFWFMLEKKEYATRKWPAVRGFLLHLLLYGLILTLFLGWKYFYNEWKSLF
jgi:hypothetical protein